MFTGIVERSTRIISTAEGTGFRRINAAHDWHDLKLGESIAINGVCLTIAEFDAGVVSFDVIPETLSKTNLGLLRAGDHVHVERAMRVGDRIDGHFVQGHVDGTAILKESKVLPGETRLTVEPPPGMAKFIVTKGSVCIDGVSLTVAALHPNAFEVALIPTTLQRTTLGDREPGWPFNFEADVLSKTIIGWLERTDTRQLVGGMQSAMGNR